MAINPNDYLILGPSMLPIHFKLLTPILEKNGYHLEILTNEGDKVKEAGLSHVHNDTCYPCLLVVGQMIDALKSGKYDLDHTALVMTQTAGGCRASNYISLLRKALKQEGMEKVPCFSINYAGLEKGNSLHFTPTMILSLLYAAEYGDALLWLKNQIKPYETEKGATEKAIDEIVEILIKDFESNQYLKSKKILRMIIQKMKDVPQDRNCKKVKIGIVGEIYMKYSPLGNSHLEDFLIDGGFEPVLSGVLDFGLYCIQNSFIDYKYYRMNILQQPVMHFIKRAIMNLQNQFLEALKEDGEYDLPDNFDEVFKNGKTYINPGVKMGEGWLLTSEVVTLIKSGVDNVVMCQPFGCLPNHIVAKGMVRKIKDDYPNANIVAIDFDPSASKVNQENRIRLLMANARLSLQKEKL